VIKILKTTICGTDLHIKKGDLPAVTDGRILGHEGVGVVDEIGDSVSTSIRATTLLFHVFRRAESAATAKKVCIRIVRMVAAGY